MISLLGTVAGLANSVGRSDGCYKAWRRSISLEAKGDLWRRMRHSLLCKGLLRVTSLLPTAASLPGGASCRPESMEDAPGFAPRIRFCGPIRRDARSLPAWKFVVA
eukprot:12236829-Heterocapsa_arctica.AAC.1